MNNNLDDNNVQNNNDTYRANQNLNTAIENPQINIDNVNSINIKDVEFNNMATIDNPDNNSNNINNNFDNNINQNDNNLNFNQPEEQQIETENETTYEPSTQNNNTNYSYEPITNSKKRTDENAISSLIHSKEFKVTVFIIFILVMFLLVMPYIYDFIRNLQM